MGKGGKYLKKNVAAKAAGKVTGKKKKKKVLPIILLVVALILVAVIGFGVWYYFQLLNMLSRPGDDIAAPPATEPTAVIEMTEATEEEETTVGTTSPEETWPEIVSDENITNIMLVGQAAREGEEHLISDTMILVSINRETKTLTLTSLMRDMCLVWPKYVDTLGKTHTGNNRINMAYNMGYHWTGNKQDSMDLLESIVQHNFGIPVERTIEVDFDLFAKIVDKVGNLWILFDKDEIKYMQDNYGSHMPNANLKVGRNWIDGYQALCYARMRKVGHGDYERTERQREVITALLNRVKKMNILQIHGLFMEILPMITTDLSNKEITDYAFEFIPMLKDLTVQSQRIPFEGNEQSISRELENGTIDWMIAPGNLKTTAEQLQRSIGMIPAE